MVVATRQSAAGEEEAEEGREGEMVRFIDLFLHVTNIYLASIIYKILFPVGCYRAGLGII